MSCGVLSMTTAMRIWPTLKATAPSALTPMTLTPLMRLSAIIASSDSAPPASE